LAASRSPATSAASAGSPPPDVDTRDGRALSSEVWTSEVKPRFGVVHADVVAQGQIGARVGRSEFVEICAEPTQGPPVSGVVVRVEGDLNALPGSPQLPRELAEGTKQIADVVQVGVMNGQ